MSNTKQKICSICGGAAKSSDTPVAGVPVPACWECSCELLAALRDEVERAGREYALMADSGWLA